MTFGKSSTDNRKLSITDDMARLDPKLIGLLLAPVWRRALAMSVDLLLIAVITIPLLIGLYYAKIRLLDPELYQAIQNTLADADNANEEVNFKQLNFVLFKRIEQQSPDILPGDLAAHINSSNDALLREAIDKYRWEYSINFSTSDENRTKFDSYEKTARIGLDTFAGNFLSVLNIGIIFILYFTLFGWVLRGSTPGKTLFSIQVVRLNGLKMTFYESFGRAGGYSASIATLGLGFLEAFWHPNRQTVHDRICSTVVIYYSKKQTVKLDND